MKLAIDPETDEGAEEAREDVDRLPRILVCEDDPKMCELVASVLKPLEAEVVGLTDSQEALDYLERSRVEVVVTDLKMPRVDGLDVLRFAKQQDSSVQVVMITGYGTVESAVEALKSGAYDYIRKPFDNAELYHTVGRALEHNRLSMENRRLRAEQRLFGSSALIGQSAGMVAVQRLVDAAAAYDCSVLIGGQSGSGKELVARQIHTQSPRADHAFVAVNCAAIPEDLIESELFGYRRGAFTGADRDKPGLFEAANGGTIFLDEINNASLSLQAKLLRVLQDGAYYAMGDTQPRTTDVRVLAASNRAIPELIESGHFRGDLFYRLKVIEIDVPPLRDRRDDIPLLTQYFLHKYTRKYGKSLKGVTTPVLGALMRYDWPGNVRELENLVQRMVILAEGEKIDTDVLPPELQQPGEVVGRALDHIPPQSLEEVEAYFIRKTLHETEGDRALTAEILGINKSTLWRKIKKYQLEGGAADGV
ncbi:MAG: sigma-54-dependent transcriptional regulator [Thiohalorhabdus sp.]|uniref:sigma-54-dependent transcriptional regulator n=1 Tax=Thiohalorhabdus sp. TaxID=3094134 RepID=UPI00397F9BB4